MPVDALAKRLANIAQVSTQRATIRPYGIGTDLYSHILPPLLPFPFLFHPSPLSCSRYPFVLDVHC